MTVLTSSFPKLTHQRAGSCVFRPVFRPLGALWAQLGHRSHPGVARHPQVGQRKQRYQLGGILGQAAVANLHMAELTLDYPERMLDLGAYGRCRRVGAWRSAIIFINVVLMMER